MTQTERRLIEKLEEYIEHLKQCSYYGWNILSDKYEPDIDQLKQQVEQEEKPESLDALMTHDKKTIARWYLDLLNGNGRREELLRYKIWENIFSGGNDTVETLIEKYFEYLKNRTNGSKR
jgi:hypothetical protein